METTDLKKSIQAKIEALNDETTLQSLDAILNNSEEDLVKVFSFIKDQMEQKLETADYNSFIKEWVKSM